MAGAARHLLISGPMGTGKSTVGRLVADRLSLPFTDLDADVEAQAGCSVAALFAREGEAGFRVRERRALEAALAGPAAVIALGGGTIVDPENRHLIRQHGRLVTLTASLETLAERLAGDTTRPLLAGGIEALADLVAVRSVAYADADVVVATDGRDPEAVAAAVVAAWRGAA
ncbi:MAG: shikimate kinase [Myxococcales bacterium]|nr:shikimate kinase [Myxococcales bacterium]